MDEPTPCACGKTHAPWWGKYVAAPSCKVFTTDMIRRKLFNDLVEETVDTHWRR